jgi:hypothetical protein
MWVSRSIIKGIIVENGILDESSSRDRRSKNNYAKNSIKEKIISKEFFSTIKMKPYKTSTLVFKDEKGMTIWKRKNLEEVCCKFYNKLFKCGI